uniref:uncharacterized protein LOC108950714 isoform X2 n=1 Tax=Ciona intestinalis TaxID=7719 RepID=UPI000EF49B6A|nr:uncharacterized protein LOC108950714 isoform X2 [Ciona intestinalis]|eukprot:XP_026695488.1 uncharacterized protein LOC108950714 isoform X2 [Ciona intestinalis]
MSDTSVIGYAMIGVGAIVVLVICGIIYIKCYRNNKPTTYNVDERNSGSEEGPVVVDNVLYGTSAEPIQDLYEEADKVDPVYSCADASASYVAPNVEFHAEAAVYDCTPDNASADNGQSETDDSSREDSIEDVYAQVVKKKKT